MIDPKTPLAWEEVRLNAIRVTLLTGRPVVADEATRVLRYADDAQEAVAVDTIDEAVVFTTILGTTLRRVVHVWNIEVGVLLTSTLANAGFLVFGAGGSLLNAVVAGVSGVCAVGTYFARRRDASALRALRTLTMRGEIA